MAVAAAAGRSDQQQLGRERFLWWFRAGAAAFVAFQNAIEPGDRPWLSWLIFAVLAASVAAGGLALQGRPDARRVARVGVASMAADAAVTTAVMANNLTDPAEPIYLIGVLAMLEATIRWRRWGGIVAGAAAGLAAGTWTVVVTDRAFGSPQLDHASMRAGVIAGLGVFLGFLVRQIADQHDHLQGILDTAQDLVVTVGADGRIRSINAASLAILGWTPEELVGRPYTELIHQDDLVQRSGPLDLPPDAPVLFERRVHCRDGSSRWLEMNVAATPAGLLQVSARDVTERREARRRLEESEQRFRSLFDHNTDAVYAFDLEGRFTMANPATERITGYPSEEILGTPFAPLVTPDDRGSVAERFALAAAGHAQGYETVVHHRSGRPVTIDVTNVPIVVDGGIVGVFGIAKDVTERRQLERQLGHQATHDALTGLPNRAHLELALEAAARAPEPRSLLFIDLDRFKLVNDSLGHRSGDELLVAAVERLRRHVRSDDLLARWAGDEFCVLLAPGTSDDLALTVADRLRSVLAEPFRVGERDVRLSASIGLASSGADEAERLVQIADLAMYQAKRAGRDRVAVYSPTATPLPLGQLDLEAALAAALEDGQVTVHYQPIVETQGGAVRAVEALARWPRPDGTMRLPGDFVPFAEESGLVRLLTRHVVRDACRQLVRWDRLARPVAGLQAWVNVSVADLESATFAAEVAAALESAGLDPSRLVLEVTETMLMRDVDQVECTIAALGDAGIQLAIDDFGTGYSSLSQLHRLQVGACKIDREFVSQAPDQLTGIVMLRALVDVGLAFGVPVVAEGIERPEELAAAAATGCPLAQGYLLAVPAPPEQLDEVLAAGLVALPDLAGLSGGGAVPSGR